MMIRKAFHHPFVLPLSLRVFGSNERALTLNISTSLQQDVSLNRSRSFSVIANSNDLVDSNLRKILKHEIKSIKFNLKNKQVDIPDSYPFKQVDENDHRTLILRSKCADEWITIIIFNYFASNYEYKNCEDDHEDKQEMKVPPAIPMIVSVQKPGIDEILVFEMTISPKDITIQRFYFGDDLQTNYYHYDGPKFSELDKELQESLYKYLEVRGINSNLLRFLPKYIAVDTYKNDIKSLKDLMKYIKN